MSAVTERLVVRGAREHNLRNISLDLPRDALIVFTGLSGSGKSSLAFDTIFAEGQRRYVESLSAYARQFLGQMDKPDVDFIEGLSPAVSIDQKSTSRNPRSTVGTITEVYDYLRLLYARAGRPHCPICGEPISRQSPQQIVDRLMALPEGTRFQVLAPVIRGRKGEYAEVFRQLASEGFSRARVDGEVVQLTDPPILDKKYKHTIDVIVDRLAVKPTVKQRLTDSVETALGLAQGVVTVDFVDLDPKDPDRERSYSEKMACPNNHDIAIDELEPRQFSFNGPWGACPECHGLGTRMEVDPELVVPDDEKSLAEGAIAPWASAHVADYFNRLIESLADSAGFSMTTPVAPAAGHGPADAAQRRARPGARALPEPLRPRAQLQRQVRGGHLLHRAPARRGGERHLAGAVRRVHARGAVPGLQGRPAEADLAGGHRRRPEHRRDRRDVDRRGGGLPAPAGADRPGAADRRAGAQGDQRAAQVPARRRPGLPVAEPAHRQPVRRRGAADPAGHPDRLRAGRGALRAGRAEHRAAPAGQPAADRDPGPAARPGQHPDRGRARRGHHPHRRLGGRHRARARGSTAATSCTPARSSGAAGQPGLASPAPTCPAAARSRCRRRRRPRTKSRVVTVHNAVEHNLQQRHGVVPARPADRRHRGVRLRQVHPGQRHPLHRVGQADLQRPRGARPAPLDHRRRRDRQDHPRRPVADRADPAIQPGDLHRGVRPHARLFAETPGGQGPRLPARPVLLQRQGRPLRELHRRRHDQDRDELPARRVRAVRGLPRRAVQPGDPRGALQGQVHLRDPRHVDRGGGGLLRRHPGDQPAPEDPGRGRPRATSGSASRRPPSPAARRSGSSWPASCRSGPPAAPCTCWTSRPPGCTSRTSASCSGCSAGWSTPATRWWSSSTTWT